MATVKQALEEHDVVSLVEAVDKVEGIGKWPAGTVGAIVIDYGDMKMIEVANERGETLDLPMVPVEKLELVAKHSH